MILAILTFGGIINAQVFKMDSRVYRFENSKWFNYSSGSKGDKIIPERLIVRLSNKRKPVLSEFTKLGITDIEISPRRILGNYYVIEIDSDGNPFEIAQKLYDSNDFEYVEFDALGNYAVEPQDPQFPYQWNLDETKLRMGLAWNITTGDKSILLAIIDSGTEYFHEDLDGNIWVNPGEDIDGDGLVGDFGSPGSGGDENGIDDDGNGYIDDLMGWDFLTDDNTVDGNYYHGTAVAGIAGAQTHNYENGAYRGVAGIAGGLGNTPGASLMIIKANYDLFEEEITASGIGLSITYAAENGADVMNISMGVYDNYSYLEDPVNEAVDNYDCVIVAASLNNGENRIRYPARYSNTIAVGATNQNDNWYNYSNYGPELDVVAPANVYTTTKNNGYITNFNGTSAASPHVAGLAALIRSVDPTLSWSEVRTVIRNTADKVPGMNGQPFTTKYGYGRINAHAALAYVSADGAPPATPQNFQVTTYTEIYPYRPKLTWTANTEPDLVGYRIERKINDGSWSPPNFGGDNVAPDETEFIDMEILIWNSNNNQTVYYRMQAFDIEELYSSYTQVKSIDFRIMFKPEAHSQPREDISSKVPLEFELNQNYPNPFNPETRIRFGLPEDSKVTIEVFNLQGRKVATLADGHYEAGYHSVTFSGANYPSGVYFYRTVAGDFQDIKRMLLVK